MEGGWPENVDSTEADQVERFLKKANKVRLGIAPGVAVTQPHPAPSPLCRT